MTKGMITTFGTLALCMSAQRLHAAPQLEKYQFKATAITKVQVHNSSGSVHLAPTTSGEAFVILTKMKWGTRCKARVELKGQTLEVEIDDSNWILDQECRADLILSVPPQAALQVQNGTGDIKIVATRNDIDVKVGSGLVSLEGEMKKLAAISGSGDIKLRGQADQASIKTGSGDIDLDLNAAPEKGQYSIHTGSGDMQVLLPAESQLHSQISTGNGTVVNEFASSDNGNSFKLNVASEAGDIQIRKK